MAKHFEFSIIIAIYKVEEYLEESIDSVVNQTLNFQENVQLVLVNDGSPDGCGKICETYRKMFPDNVTYIEKENGGVSSARNAGLQAATGTYINFLDGDDVLSKDALFRVKEFFAKRGNEISLVALPLMNFGAEDGEHVLNDKACYTRVIDLKKEPWALQLHVSSTFIRSSVAKEYQFDTKLKYGEDAVYVNQVICQKMKYGVIAGCYYLYRKREGEDSAIQNARRSFENYTPVVKRMYARMVEEELAENGTVSRYIQNVILYDLGWKLRRKGLVAEVLSSEQMDEFIVELKKVLAHISEQAIMDARELSIDIKFYLLRLRNGQDGREDIQCIVGENEIAFYYHEFYLASTRQQKVYVAKLCCRNDQLYLYGRFHSFFPNEYELVLSKTVGETTTYYEVSRNADSHEMIAFDSVVSQSPYFEAVIPVEQKEEAELSAWVIYEGKAYPLQFGFLEESCLSRYFATMYSIQEEQILCKRNGKIQVKPYSIHAAKACESEFAAECRHVMVHNATEILNLRKEYLERYQQDKKRRVWLISDRTYQADDNAEHFFKYIASHPEEGIEPYFVIESDTPDYVRMEQYGKVVSYGSHEHKYLTLIAEKNISSHANDNTYHPFLKMKKGYSGFITAERIFLQHGIIYSDHSEWLRKENKLIDLFVTSASYEYESIAHGKYGYNDQEVVLTGLPRYDSLISSPEKEIIYVPTWDSHLTKLVNGVAVYDDTFRDTDHFKAMQEFLCHSRLLALLEKMDGKLRFRPHPNLLVQMEDFTLPERVEVVDTMESYQDTLRRGCIMVTDYSSVQFDFAYMNKPVFYYQHDGGHWKDAYFTFDEMGFGEVTHTADELVEALTRCVENNCSVQPCYQQRIDSFYAFHDRSNCQRIREAIQALDERVLTPSNEHERIVISQAEAERDSDMIHKRNIVSRGADAIVFDNQNEICGVLSQTKVLLEEAYQRENCYVLKGSIDSAFLQNEYNVFLEYGEERVQISEKEFFYEIPYTKSFVFEEDGRLDISFIAICNNARVPLAIKMKSSQLKRRYHMSCFVLEDNLLIAVEGRRLLLEKLTAEKFDVYEKKQWRFWSRKQENSVLKNITDKQQLREYRRLALFRREERLARKICILGVQGIPDKSLVQELLKQGYHIYMVTSSKKLWARLQLSYPGKVLQHGSKTHVEKTLFARKLIACDCSEGMLNPFGEDRIFYNGVIAGEYTR